MESEHYLGHSDCTMELDKFNNLIQFTKEKLIRKWSVKDLVAEVFNLYNDYLISMDQEMELYRLVDPADEEDNPAELWYNDYGCTEMFDFVDRYGCVREAK